MIPVRVPDPACSVCNSAFVEEVCNSSLPLPSHLHYSSHELPHHLPSADATALPSAFRARCCCCSLFASTRLRTTRTTTLESLMSQITHWTSLAVRTVQLRC